MSDKGKVAVVTGGGQGIGKATARALLQKGYAVAVAECDRGRAKRPKGSIRLSGRYGSSQRTLP